MALAGFERDRAYPQSNGPEIRSWLRSLAIDHIYDAVVIADLDRRVVEWNSSAERIFGYTREEALGRRPNFVNSEDPEAFSAEVAMALRQRGRWEGEKPFRRKDGTAGICDGIIVPLRDEQGKQIAIVGVHRDISDKKKVEAERDLSRSRAERLELERELREKFVAELSHDLRTPLTAAKASVSLILRSSDAGAACRMLAQRVLKDIDRADKMIRDLLDANRIRAGYKLPLDLQPFDMAELARETLDGLSAIHGERFSLGGADEFEGYWSKAGIRRMLENLCANAVKYGPKGRPIQVILEPDGDHLWLVVHNEGPPIPAQSLDLLFQPFRRAFSSCQSEESSWGLGLTLVRGLAEAHGGTVSVESSAGSGTTFRIRLPRDARCSVHTG